MAVSGAPSAFSIATLERIVDFRPSSKVMSATSSTLERPP
jgi:hypothetical protein